MEFKRLADVEALTEIPEGANAFVEVDGEIKRVPGEGLGGAGGFKTAVIKSSAYDEALAYVSGGGSGGRAGLPEVTYSCINMTFEEAYATVMSGEVLKVVFMDAMMGPMIIDGFIILSGANELGVGYMLGSVLQSPTLHWTPDGISTEEPGGGK